MDMQNTQVMHRSLTLTLTDAAGVKTVVPVQSGDLFHAVASSPSLEVTIATDANGNQELVGTPVVLESDATNGGGNITVTITDSAGNTAAELSGPDAVNIILVPPVPVITIGAPTFTTQAAPTAPGP